MSTFRNATIALAAILGVMGLVASGTILWLLRKNKRLYRQLAEAQSQPGAPYPENSGAAAMSQVTPASRTAHPYQDSYLGDDTVASTTTSPNPQHGSFVSKPPLSPSVATGRGTPGLPSEIGGQRYSELDATMGNGDRGSLAMSTLQENPEGHSPHTGTALS